MTGGIAEKLSGGFCNKSVRSDVPVSPEPAQNCAGPVLGRFGPVLDGFHAFRMVLGQVWDILGTALRQSRDISGFPDGFGFQDSPWEGSKTMS